MRRWTPTATPPASRSATRRWPPCRSTRHDFHGDWNYTIRPEPFARIDDAPDPFEQSAPTWPGWPTRNHRHAGADGRTNSSRFLLLHHAQRETKLDKRRGQRPRIKGNGTGRRPMLTLPDRLLAVVLYHRQGLPQVAIAELFGVPPETLNRRMRDLRQLLKTEGHTIPPARHRLATLEDLHAR